LGTAQAQFLNNKARFWDKCHNVCQLNSALYGEDVSKKVGIGNSTCSLGKAKKAKKENHTRVPIEKF